MDSDNAKPASEFATTQWSIVVSTGDQRSTVARDALGKLSEAYWYPLYAFIRRRGYQPARAEDLTQAFFARLIEKGTIANISPHGGRFRSFLLKAVTNFLNNEHKYHAAEKRGGNVHHQSIDFESGEQRYQFEPVDQMTPDLVFEKQWALTVIEQAKKRLAEQYQDSPQLFKTLQPTLDGTSIEPYQQLAEKLSMSQASLKVAVHRLRKRFAEKLRAVISETVESSDDISDEINYLMAAFRR